MNSTEALALLTRIGLIDGRMPSVEKAIVWADVLHDMPLDAALAALTAYQRETSGYVQPADIRAWDRRLRERAVSVRRSIEAKSRTAEPEPVPMTDALRAEVQAAYEANGGKGSVFKHIPIPQTTVE